MMQQDQAQNTNMPAVVDKAASPAKRGYVEVKEGAILDPDDIRPPIMQLVQPTSAKGTPGNFALADSGEEFPRILAVPIRIQPQMTLWPGGFNRSAQPLCWSPDGIKAGRGAKYEGQACRECKFYKQECVLGYNTILMLLGQKETDGTPSVVLFRLRGFGKGLARPFSKHARSAVLTIVSEAKVNEKGKFFVPLVGAVDQIKDEATAAQVDAVWQMVAGKEIAADPTDEAEHGRKSVV